MNILTKEQARKVRTNKCTDWVGAYITRSSSGFVRAEAARNPHLRMDQIDLLLRDERSGVISITLQHPKLSRKQYRSTLTRWKKRAYNMCLHTTFAEHRFSTIRDLEWLLLNHPTEAIQLDVLNNYAGRDKEAYKALIKYLLPPPEFRSAKDYEKWTAVQKLSYFRYYGHRYIA